MSNVILVSEDNIFNNRCSTLISRKDLKCQFFTHVEKYLDACTRLSHHVLVLNLTSQFSHSTKDVLGKIRAINKNIPVFIREHKLKIEDAVEYVKLGAENCFSEAYSIEFVIEQIAHFVQEFKSNTAPIVIHEDRSAQKVLSSPSTGEYLQAQSPQAQKMYAQIDVVKNTPLNVIIYGETGTGKESVARRLTSGNYQSKPFISIDCGCLNKELAASELFGHCKGSFSGAISDKVGAFEAANNGTLFLDEIGNLDYNVQVLLLRSIQEKKIKRVGSNEEIAVNVRIIAASNERLIEAVKKGKFREDLYYRLNEYEITIPPLRERKEDIPAFIDFFIQQSNRLLLKDIKGIHPEFLNFIMKYDWPGNLRELKNMVNRCCLFTEDYIDARALSDEFFNTIVSHINAKKDSSNIEAETSSDSVPQLKSVALKTEYELILNILKEEQFNKTKTAQRLNISRKTLYNKLKQYKIQHDI